MRKYSDDERMAIPPEGGWKNNTWYLVSASFQKNNPTAEYLFYTGFIRDGKPDSYNAFAEGGTRYEYGNAIYIEAIREIWTPKYNPGKTPAQMQREGLWKAKKAP
jgi:hypothetical protein